MTDLLAERERLYARLSRQKLHSAQWIITQAMLAAVTVEIFRRGR